MTSNNKNVQVAVRIRPLVPSEISNGCKEILDVYPGLEQIRIRDSEKAFTYNFVFGTTTSQEDVYNRAVKDLISNLFHGYNLTILAYGQTGSGKTHSMGTAYNGMGDKGVIPRAVEEIFGVINDSTSKFNFTLSVSFIELYQETVYDLLSGKSREQSTLDIREDGKATVIPGMTEIEVATSQDVFTILARGSAGRATACTNMNAQSSRSHAIFTINIVMQGKTDDNENKSARFHLVDLAGSERPKKTGAVGNTFKEGVTINKGLLVLGNVISALGDEKTQHGYIPYRDSNLTRLLKDSLGGNSITLMIACVSPADYNLEETLSTLRYADRARKIQNKPIVNQDVKAAEINELKKTIQHLRLQLVGTESCAPNEVEDIKNENTELKARLRSLTLEFSSILNDKTGLLEKVLILQNSNEELYQKISELRNEFNLTLQNISEGLENNDMDLIRQNLEKFGEMKSKFIELDTEKSKVDLEIRNHDILDVTSNNEENGDQQTESQHEIYANKQMALNTELRDLTKTLNMKEQLAKRILENAEYMVDYKGLAETQEKIANLEKEKEELLQKLKNKQSGGSVDSTKKRVQALEAQIHSLSKKVEEQARLIKIKEKDEQKVKQLNKEILLLKQNKVKLIKSMRSEADKFRTWKRERDRELAKLKQANQQNQVKIIKMEQIHNKKETVLKRKVEEANALNKKLKLSVQLRKQAELKNHGKVERAGTLIIKEFEVYVNLVEAEALLGGLLEDRAILYQQLEALKASENPDQNEIQAIEEDIELRSVQIQDLQQKILDSDEENRSVTRFDCIQTMGEAKFALKTLFEQIAQIKKQEVAAKNKTIELQAQIAEFNDKLKEATQNMKQVELNCNKKIMELQRESEERTGLLLRQLRGVAISSQDDELVKRCSIQQEKIQQQEDQIKELLEELEMYKNQSMEKEQKLKVEEKQELKKKKKSNNNNKTIVINEALIGLDDRFDSSIEDNVEKDPDWSRTPLGKWLTKCKGRNRTELQKSQLFVDKEKNLTFKRGSGGGCACTKGCSNRCGCKKFNNSCSSSCKCSNDLCGNRSDNETSHENDENIENQSVEQTFSIPSNDMCVPRKMKK